MFCKHIKWLSYKKNSEYRFNVPISIKILHKIHQIFHCWRLFPKKFWPVPEVKLWFSTLISTIHFPILWDKCFLAFLYAKCTPFRQSPMISTIRYFKSSQKMTRWRSFPEKFFKWLSILIFLDDDIRLTIWWHYGDIIYARRSKQWLSFWPVSIKFLKSGL